MSFEVLSIEDFKIPNEVKRNGELRNVLLGSKKKGVGKANGGDLKGELNILINYQALLWVLVLSFF